VKKDEDRKMKQSRVISFLADAYDDAGGGRFFVFGNAVSHPANYGKHKRADTDRIEGSGIMKIVCYLLDKRL